MVLGNVWAYLKGLCEHSQLCSGGVLVLLCGEWVTEGNGTVSLLLAKNARCPSVGRLYELGKGRKGHHQAVS